ncbi:MAG: DUF3379 domain-containing protein [Acidiferrobacterales bacterium]|nr:DUF3379 domain-containing protein [Acidiferrobacterales bacterium]
MNCLEFKRIALADPKNQESSFVEHANSCPECLKYLESVSAMDSKLASSLDVTMPEEIKAKLELNQLLAKKASKPTMYIPYAKVAGFAAVMFVSGFLLNKQLTSNTQESVQIVENQVAEMADEVIVKLVNHLDSEPVRPIWKPEHANFMMQNLMANFDPSLKVRQLPRLQFLEICPLDRKLRALHANLETDHGQITFAYIKGYPIKEVRDVSYKGQLTRIKPVHEGSLVIISNNMYAMEEADEELEEALYWDI